MEDWLIITTCEGVMKCEPLVLSYLTMLRIWATAYWNLESFLKVNKYSFSTSGSPLFESDSLYYLHLYILNSSREKHNNKVMFVFLDFVAFALNENKASNCELLKLEIWRTLVRIWIRGIHNSLSTLSRGNGGDGRMRKRQTEWEREGGGVERG